jgi:hypothetical protein
MQSDLDYRPTRTYIDGTYHSEPADEPKKGPMMLQAYRRGYEEAYSTLPDEPHGNLWWTAYDKGRADRFAKDTGLCYCENDRCEHDDERRFTLYDIVS